MQARENLDGVIEHGLSLSRSMSGRRDGAARTPIHHYATRIRADPIDMGDRNALGLELLMHTRFEDDGFVAGRHLRPRTAALALAGE